VQVYTGNFLKGDKGRKGEIYPLRCAVCLETQHFPDAVHHANFPSIIVRPLETFFQRSVYAFSTE
jgi:aldose 1-epimerase